MEVFSQVKDQSIFEWFLIQDSLLPASRGAIILSIGVIAWLFHSDDDLSWWGAIWRSLVVLVASSALGYSAALIVRDVAPKIISDIETIESASFWVGLGVSLIAGFLLLAGFPGVKAAGEQRQHKSQTRMEVTPATREQADEVMGLSRSRERVPVGIGLRREGPIGELASLLSLPAGIVGIYLTISFWGEDREAAMRVLGALALFMLSPILVGIVMVPLVALLSALSSDKTRDRTAAAVTSGFLGLSNLVSLAAAVYILAQVQERTMPINYVIIIFLGTFCFLLVSRWRRQGGIVTAFCALVCLFGLLLFLWPYVALIVHAFT